MSVRRGVPFLIALTLAALAASSASLGAQAGPWERVGQELLGAGDRDWFGFEVSLSGDGQTLLVTNQGLGGSADPIDQAHVYRLQDGAWTQVGQSVVFDMSMRSAVLSHDGQTFVAGFTGQVDVGGGEVRTLDLVDGSWQLRQVLTSDNPTFGWSVDISKDSSTLAVGASNSFTGEGVGEVQVYDDSANGWTPMGAPLRGGGDGGEFGATVLLAANGERLVVGAPRHDGPNYDPANPADDTDFNLGFVRMYERTGSSWNVVGGDIAGLLPRDEFGRHVDVSEDGGTVAIGSTRSAGLTADPGAVHLFDLVGGSWTRVGAEIQGSVTYGDFGYALGLSADGESLVVGAPQINSGQRTGSVRALRRFGKQWIPLGGDFVGAELGGRMGWSVAMSEDGSTIAFGAPDFGDPEGQGRVNVHRLGGPLCAGLPPTILGTAADDILVGTDGMDVIIGLQGNDLIRGGDGDDAICAGQGNDTIFGGLGFDLMFGAQGSDVIYFANGQRPDERVDVAGGRAFGGAGNDSIFGSTRWDRMQGGEGNDRLFGFEGRDWMRGGGNNDALAGGPNVDDLNGGPGSDSLFILSADVGRGGLGADTCVYLGNDAPLARVACESNVSGQ